MKQFLSMTHFLKVQQQTVPKVVGKWGNRRKEAGFRIQKGGKAYEQSIEGRYCIVPLENQPSILQGRISGHRRGKMQGGI